MERVSFLADCVLRFAPGRQKREQWKNPFKEQMQEGRSTIKSAKKQVIEMYLTSLDSNSFFSDLLNILKS